MTSVSGHNIQLHFSMGYQITNRKQNPLGLSPLASEIFSLKDVDTQSHMVHKYII